MMSKFALCLPVYNEEFGIQNYLLEISHHLGADIDLIVLNDASKDETMSQLETTTNRLPNLYILSNETNLGHGRSVRRLVDFALMSGFDCILTIDGDGQVSGEELQKFFKYCVEMKFGYCEGIRTNRSDPMYRKFVSALTRLIVFSFSGKYPMDGNTPIRFYDSKNAKTLWTMVPEYSIVPNIHISIASRRLKMNLHHFRVITRDRLGTEKIGSTWKEGRKSLQAFPPRKFISFCWSAMREILRLLIR